MSREVKRVALDFDWPLNKVWEGFLLPERLREDKCGECGSDGRTPAGQWLHTILYLLLMLPDEVPGWKNPRTGSARRNQLHPWLQCLEFRPNVPPSADIAELTGGLAGRAPRQPLGHDAVDQWSAAKAVIKAAGLDPDSWGLCPVCKGRATVETYEGQRDEAEAWQPSEPPAGEGWQLWETVSEGSPISPVFPVADDLAEWMSDPGRGRNWVPPEVAAKFIGEGWAPSLVSGPGGVMSGVEWVGTTERKPQED